MLILFSFSFVQWKYEMKLFLFDVAFSLNRTKPPCSLFSSPCPINTRWSLSYLVDTCYIFDICLLKTLDVFLIFCGFYFRHGRSQPMLVSQLRLHDTCGVHNLHGMPAILSAIFSAYYASVASIDNYKDSLNDIFPAMNFKNSSYALEHNTTTIIGVNNF